VFFIASYIFSIFSYGRALPSGVFVPVILTGAVYGRFVSIFIGSVNFRAWSFGSSWLCCLVLVLYAAPNYKIMDLIQRPTGRFFF
jgi:H+/Cl- antiporter ClcA